MPLESTDAILVPTHSHLEFMGGPTGGKVVVQRRLKSRHGVVTVIGPHPQLSRSTALEHLEGPALSGPGQGTREVFTDPFAVRLIPLGDPVAVHIDVSNVVQLEPIAVKLAIVDRRGDLHPVVPLQQVAQMHSRMIGVDPVISTCRIAPKGVPVKIIG